MIAFITSNKKINQVVTELFIKYFLLIIVLLSISTVFITQTYSQYQKMLD